MRFTTIHLWNSLLCPPLGFGLNFLLLWLILHRTPKEMVVHSRVLLQTCVCDFVLLTLQLVGQNLMLFDPNQYTFIILFDGYCFRLFNWAAFGPELLSFLHFLWSFLHFFSNFGISVQFVYRYLVLNRQLKVTAMRYFLLLLGPLISMGLLSGVTGFCYRNSLNLLPIDRQLFGNFVNLQGPPLYLSIKDENKITSVFHVALGLVSVLNAISYAFILVCGWKMVRFVRDHATFNPRMKELNRQLTRNLIVLACFPLLLEFMSSAYFYEVLSEVGMQEFQFFSNSIAHWLPVLNPVASILTNRPYRDAVFRGKIRSFFCKNNNAIVPQT